MKVPGYVAAVIGLVIALLAVVNHFMTKLPAIGGIAKGSLILGIVGVVLIAIGGYMAMQKSKSA
jgi:hypothetical protein